MFRSSSELFVKFLPDLSTVLALLYRLLHKGPGEMNSRKLSKLLTSECLLVHYDPNKELVLACDTSPYGVGAALSHRGDGGREQPIAFASRSLGTAEKIYSQLEKDGLVIVFGLKSFHQYPFGRHFTILSDHKPLQQLFKETRATPTMVAACGHYFWEVMMTPSRTNLVSSMEMRILSVACHYLKHRRMFLFR